MPPWAYVGWWYHGDGRKLTEALYARHNMMPLLCGISGAETAGWFRQPLESIDDLSGLKIRFAGLGGKAMQRVGASVTMLPAGEIFQALETGVIDATEYAQPVVNQALGFARIAKYNYFPGWHQRYRLAYISRSPCTRTVSGSSAPQPLPAASPVARPSSPSMEGNARVVLAK